MRGYIAVVEGEGCGCSGDGVGVSEFVRGVFAVGLEIAAGGPRNVILGAAGGREERADLTERVVSCGGGGRFDEEVVRVATSDGDIG